MLQVRTDALQATVEGLVAAARRDGRKTLLEPEALNLLEALGIITPARRTVRGAADVAGLDVAKVDGDLVVSTPTRRRAIALPRAFAPLALTAAELSDGTLRVRFAPVTSP